MFQQLGGHQTPLTGFVDHLGLVNQIEQRKGGTHQYSGLRQIKRSGLTGGPQIELMNDDKENSGRC